MSSDVALNRCGAWRIVESAPYFFGAAAAATGSAVNVPAASNGFTLIVPSSLFAEYLAA